VAAEDVKVGDLILNAYAPRTWSIVVAAELHSDTDPEGCCVMLDTPTNRTWWRRKDPVPCKQL
jgi:hypothetical protein